MKSLASIAVFTIACGSTAGRTGGDGGSAPVDSSSDIAAAPLDEAAPPPDAPDELPPEPSDAVGDTAESMDLPDMSVPDVAAPDVSLQDAGDVVAWVDAPDAIDADETEPMDAVLDAGSPDAPEDLPDVPDDLPDAPEDLPDGAGDLGEPVDAGVVASDVPDVSCDPGFGLIGGQCLDLDECQGGGSGCAQGCENLPGTYACSCGPGWLLAADGHACDDVDECAAGTSGCTGGCEDFDGGFTCTCAAGFELGADAKTCIDMDECAKGLDACNVQASCTNVEGGYTCSCGPGYEGDGFACAAVDVCATSNPCYPGSCVGGLGSVACSCPCGYVAGTPASCVPLVPKTLFVNPKAKQGGDGTCWEKAFNILHAALLAAPPGWSIWITEGTYKPGPETTDTFGLPKDVSLYGGFVGSELSLSEAKPSSHATVFDGDLGKSDTNIIGSWDEFANADDVDRVVTVPDGGTSARLQGITIRGGRGGVLLQAGDLTVSGVKFRENGAYKPLTATGGSLHVTQCAFEKGYGAVYATGAAVDLVATTFGATSFGNAVAVEFGTLSMTGTTITGGKWESTRVLLTDTQAVLDGVTISKPPTGTAVSATGGRLTLRGCTFDHVPLGSTYGAVSATDLTLVIRDSSFHDNFSGCVGMSNVTADIADTTFKSNIDVKTYVDGYKGGGGIVAGGSDVTLRHAVFEGNTNPGAGAVSSTGGRLHIEGSLFTKNTGRVEGGAVYHSGGQLLVDGCTFDQNTSKIGSALALGSTVAIVRRSTFTKNIATDNGTVATWNYHYAPYPVHIISSTFDGNTAVRGAVVGAFDQPVDLVQCLLRGNVAAANGSTLPAAGQGGAFYAGARIRASWCTFADNTATAGALATVLDFLRAGVELDHSVVWPGAGSLFAGKKASVKTDHSFLPSGQALGNGDVALSASPFDPAGLGTDPAEVDLRLAVGSPCVDAFAADALPQDAWDADADGNVVEALPIDRAGRPRLSGAAVDAGALERCSTGECASAAPACGDGICAVGEDCLGCASDCGPCALVCGDASCAGAETCEECPDDCGACAPVCGDGECVATESCLGCAPDCGACPVVCGDGYCDATETCTACSGDCGPCPPVCGDGTCADFEDCSTCATDCGGCPLPCDAGSCTGQLCTPDGWCVVSPVHHANLMRAFWGSTPERPDWAVGEAGTTMSFDGTTWTTHAPITPWTLNAVWGSALDDVWAAGERGVLLHHDGVGWSLVPSLAKQALRGLWGFGKDDVWAVGEAAILHRSEAGWAKAYPIKDGSSLPVYAVWGSAPDDVYVVGSAYEGLLYHWDSAAWTYGYVFDAFNTSFTGVWGFGPDQVFAVSAYTVIRHDNGFKWVPMKSSPTVYSTAIHGTSPSDLWAVGPDGRSHYDGTKWTNESLTWGRGPRSVFAGTDGRVWASTDGGTLQKLESGKWTNVFDGAYEPNFWGWNDLWAADDDTVFLVDGSRVRRYGPDGSVSNQTVPYLWPLAAVWGAAANDVWAVGTRSYGTEVAPENEEQGVYVMHFDGSTWTEPKEVGVLPPSDVWGAASDDVWMAGGFGLMHYDGADWTPWAWGLSPRLTALHGTGPDNVWAVGENGSSYHFDGVEWVAHPIEGATSIDDCTAVIAFPDGKAWATDGSDLWRFDGRAWTQKKGGIPEFKNAFAGASEQDLLVAGGQGGIGRFDGGAWHLLMSGTSSSIVALWRTAQGKVWAVAGGPTLLVSP